MTARVGAMWVNPHCGVVVNGENCDAADPSATLRHFHGTDLMGAIRAAGCFNGRSHDFAIVAEVVRRAIATFGPVREVYILDTTPDVVIASFGDVVKNRLWIGPRSIQSCGWLHPAQYLNRKPDLWKLDLP